MSLFNNLVKSILIRGAPGVLATCQLHHQCRSVDQANLKIYAVDKRTNRIVHRPCVPDDKTDWSIEWPEYAPVEFTLSRILDSNRPEWADPPDPLAIKNWNHIDGQIDRRSSMGVYDVIDGVPRNPMGRTGIAGRGVLGKWGPNNAADPIVTRWKMNEDWTKVVDKASGKPVLQFVAIRRVDTGSWAIPGGMRDTGERISQTLKREFMEEALDALNLNDEKKSELEEKLRKLFDTGVEIYRGYVDDPRNTDNSWMETMAYNFHDEQGEILGQFVWTAGDDASSVKWLDLDKELRLYANHRDFLHQVALLHNAHW